MIEQKQLIIHDPGSGAYGDCFRTSIACLLDLQPDEVPHFCDGPSGTGGGIDGAQRWLAERGLGLVEIPFDGKSEVDELLHQVSHFCPPGCRFLLGGFSRTGCNHSVIAADGKIVWDPSLTDAGIVGPMDDGYWWVSFLVRLT